MLVRAPMLVPLRPGPDLKLPATASPEQRVTWLDTASRMPTVESAARVPDQAPPGETVNVVAASAGAAANATAATTNTGMANRPALCFMIPPQRGATGIPNGHYKGEALGRLGNCQIIPLGCLIPPTPVSACAVPPLHIVTGCCCFAGIYTSSI